MKIRTVVILTVAVAVAITLFSTTVFVTGFAQFWQPYQMHRYSGGMMGIYNGGMMGAKGEILTIQQATQMMQSTPSYAKVFPNNNTIVFTSKDISIFALAIMPDRAVNLTGMQPPSYSQGDVFVIYTLINPVLVMPNGASVHFTISNLDDDMYHNLVVSSIGPPYPYMAMQGMMHSSTFPVMYMMPFLSPADYAQSVAHEYSYTLTFNQPGPMWYLCTYPGHAQLGMYGQIVVKN